MAANGSTYLLFEHSADLLREVHELVHVPYLLRGPQHARVVHKRPGIQNKTIENKTKHQDETKRTQEQRIGKRGKKWWALQKHPL